MVIDKSNYWTGLPILSILTAECGGGGDSSQRAQWAGLCLPKQDLSSFSINCCQRSCLSILFSLEVVGNWLSLSNWIIIDMAASAGPTKSASLEAWIKESISQKHLRKVHGYFVCLKTAWSGTRNAESLSCRGCLSRVLLIQWLTINKIE